MPDIIIPARNVGSLKQESTKFEWSEGSYRGTIEKSEVRELPTTKTDGPFAGYISTEGERLSIMIGAIESLEGQPSAGNQKYFLDLALSMVDSTTGVVSWDLGNYTDAPQGAWQLERSARFITNLAAALGAVELVDDDTLRVPDAFIDQLKTGAFDGNIIGFNLYKNAKKYVDVESFFRA